MLLFGCVCLQIENTTFRSLQLTAHGAEMFILEYCAYLTYGLRGLYLVVPMTLYVSYYIVLAHLAAGVNATPNSQQHLRQWNSFNPFHLFIKMFFSVFWARNIIKPHIIWIMTTSFIETKLEWQDESSNFIHGRTIKIHSQTDFSGLSRIWPQ